MALPSWPAVPYRPARDSFQPIKPFLDPIATEMEGGNTRQRPRPGDNVATLGQTIMMTPAEAETFKTWVKTTLANGTARFTAQVWTGAAYVSKTCQFAKDGKPTYGAFSATRVVVAMKLLVYDF
ncbi:hypothetical protein ACVMGC_011552 [Bradyrhizobium barranii subsp. barranii]|uniref:hypothetical protein n=1 Tax=Bradyrhizobium TaxID=374 RepID=UPI0004051953|nr:MULTISPECIES: hypothetical protein [Bradyrhizobium]MBR0882188.1 hypothetical protein [Bradyrhizobium liaoningense]MBR1004829.1 hypothetical protein [Bradyrhizobium liaoningense]MCP1741707.1 hypothetical protein [Bradyrhizobium japonicum]MCP1779469.1 hypothetical protein [Bradyrhizobium japonicum]MCP1859417.1 hypothetical protein [Bradyrhizobium japonicum]